MAVRELRDAKLDFTAQPAQWRIWFRGEAPSFSVKPFAELVE
jgi:hypothetical protein